MGVFARWVVGVRVYARGVFVWVFALLGVGALVGWWDSVVPPPLCPGLLACVLTLWCGLVGVCAACACPMGGGRPGRGGTTLSRPFTCVGGAVHRPMRGEEGEKGWG